MNERVGFRIPIPWFGNVAVGGDQPLSDNETGAGNPGPQLGCLIRVSDVVYAIDVTDGIAILVQHAGRHALRLLELLYVLVQFGNLLLHGRVGLRGIAIDDHACANEYKNSSGELDKANPGLANDVRFCLLGFAELRIARLIRA